MKTIDTKQLAELCERITRKCKAFNGNALPKAKDEEWAELVQDALPALRKFLDEN